MPLNTSRRDVVEQRRTRVANMLAQHKTQREIAAQLGCSLGTVNRDIQALDKRWRQAADVDIATHRGRQLAEVAYVIKCAWMQGPDPVNLRVVLQAIKLAAQITGTVAPPSFTVNLALFMQFEQAIRDSGIPPSKVGEAFGAWFTEWADKKQALEGGGEAGHE